VGGDQIVCEPFVLGVVMQRGTANVLALEQVELASALLANVVANLTKENEPRRTKC
jgi:hypothetical protein